MSNISAIFAEKGSGPYSKALKVRVVAVDDEPIKYRGKDGNQKSSLNCAVSDGNRVILAVCYDPSKFGRFKVCFRTLISTFPLLLKSLCRF